MAELTEAARVWLQSRQQAILITLRADGSPQSSNIFTHFDGSVFRISVTADRAKTKNLARDPRATMHVPGSDFWSYASVSCSVDLSPVSATPGDQPGRALLAVYNTGGNGPHPDEAAFFDAMVTERRLLLTLTPESIAGQGW